MGLKQFLDECKLLSEIWTSLNDADADWVVSGFEFCSSKLNMKFEITTNSSKSHLSVSSPCELKISGIHVNTFAIMLHRMQKPTDSDRVKFLTARFRGEYATMVIAETADMVKLRRALNKCHKPVFVWTSRGKAMVYFMDDQDAMHFKLSI